MSFTLNTQASDLIVAIATVSEDLRAAARHSLASDNLKGRKALAGYIRDKQAEMNTLLRQLGGVSEVAAITIEAAIAQLRQARKETAITLREARERRAAELALMQAEMGMEGAAA